MGFCSCESRCPWLSSRLFTRGEGFLYSRTLSKEVQFQISEALESFKSELRKEGELINIRRSKLEENKNQEIKERRDSQDNICDRLVFLKALKEEVHALE